MALAADLSIVETDRLTAVVSTASAVTAATISIADSCTLIAGFFFRALGNFVIAQLICSIFIVKTKLATTTNLAALYFEPNPFSFFAIMAQFTHALQQLIIFRSPRMVVQCICWKNRVYTGSK